MRIRRALRVLLVSSIAMLGCGMPLRIVRVDDPSAPVEGVRYYLRRPQYVLGLRVHDLTSAHVFNIGNAGYKDDRGIRTYSLRGSPYGPRAPLPESGLCLAAQTPVEFRLTQRLDGLPILYEARGTPWYAAPFHMFSDTNFTITLDETGTLAALSAGETDRSLEVIQAVAGLAVSAAKMTAAEVKALDCYAPLGADSQPDPAFQKYLHEHRGLVLELERNTTIRESVRGRIDGRSPKDTGEALAVLQTLDQAIAQLNARLKAVQYNVPDHRYKLMIAGRARDRFGNEKPTSAEIEKAAGEKAAEALWVVVTLEEVARKTIPLPAPAKAPPKEE